MTIADGLTTQHQLDAFYDFALELSAERRLDAVLDVALRQCLELTESEFGFIGLVAEGSPAMDIVAIQGFHPAPAFYTEHRTIPLRPNVFARAVLEDRSVRTVDASTEPQRVGQPPGHPPVGAFLGVPLRVDGRPIGMIGVANRPTAYGEHHERLMLTYAGLVAMHVRSAQLYEALQIANDQLERQVEERTAELAAARDALVEKAARLKAVLTDTVDTQEQERHRIAGDLHDGVGQLLIGAMLELTSAGQRLDAGQPHAARAALTQAGSIVSQVEVELRRVVFDLHPPMLQDLGLAAALRDMVERFARFAGVDAECVIEGRPVRLPAPAEIGVYRMVQEALGNIAAHAGATTAEIRLGYRHDMLAIEVTDDGVGFDLAGIDGMVRSGHLGLESMRRRVESVSGSWTVASDPGRGTVVRARIPVG